ncbi:MAG: Rrf2 family transcriptional regulator [Holophaga sp.]|nr:Rrf2 family transcriptional regulator [Holophaga sp.]
MKVSTKGRYGLRVMMELAIQAGKGPVLVGNLAQAQDLPPKYLHILLGSLRAAGLVRASRGPNGGYELAREASQITALEVVEILEGRILLSECESNCARVGTCAAQEIWEEAATAMASVLGKYTLAALAERQRSFVDDPSGYSI